MQDLISKERALMLAEYAWLKLTPDEIDAAGPGPLKEDLFKKNQFIPIDLIAAMANPDYFPFTCKHILGVEIIPLQHLILKNMFKYPFPMLIASRGFGKTFMLAVYCFLRMLLNPGCRIVIAGAAFRQSKLVFEYMEKIWREAPILRDIGGPGSGPSKYNDHCIFRFGGGHTMAIPIGDGCLAGDTMIMCDDGFKTMESVINPSGEQEEFNAPYQGQVWDVTGWGNAVARRYNGVKPAIRLVTRRGYEITGTHNHKFEVFDGKEVVWRRLDQMAIGDRILINSRPRWHNGQSALNESDAYQLGRSFLDDELSPALLSSRKEVFSAFLQGWFDGRGYYDGNKEVYGKLPEKLSKQLQYIFLCYGFVSERRLSDDSYYELVVYKDTVFVDDEIISLEDAGNIPTYDIEIDEIHRYNANGFCSHNSKIRGLRANYIIMDEFASHSKEIFQRVIQGFASVSAKPIDNVKEAAKRRALKELGLWSERDEQRYQDREVNQTIITGTAYYSFNLFYEYWKQYKEILGSMGDPKKMRDVFGDDMSDFINYKDFCIMRIPYDLIPEGFMDDKQVSHNRATSHTSLYAMEYGSCALAGTPVITQRGIIPIETVRPNEDSTITHKGRWKKITKLYYRDYDGFIFKYKTPNWPEKIGVTVDHPFWYGENTFGPLKNYCQRANLDGSVDTFSLLDKKREHYTGVVYNLEVEDDHSYSLPSATVHNCFSADSDGFFKRSLIESCTSPLKLYDENIDFKPVLSGREGYQYVMGIDPASEQDNLAIVIIEIHKNHRRIVYCWTINKKEQRRRVKAAEEGESDFYAFVARKIRQLMQVFKIERIGMDIEGGGRAIEEALHNKNNLRPGEHPIWQVVDDNKPKETDDYPGLHIIEPINFSLHEWVSTANHGLKKDMEDKFILFPAFDAAMLGVIIEDEKLREELADTKMVFDTLEDCMMDIEELKNELTTITVSATPNSGRERWDTPEFKLPGGRKGRYRKDRYSALLIANMMARAIAPRQYDIKYEHMGGFVGNMPEKKAEKMFIGPDWYEQKMRGVYD